MRKFVRHALKILEPFICLEISVKHRLRSFTKDFYSPILDLIIALKPFLNLRIIRHLEKLRLRNSFIFKPSKCTLLYISSKFCMRAKQLCIKIVLLLSRVFVDSERQPGGTSSILSRNPYLDHQFVRYIFCSLPSRRQQGYQVF